MCSCPHDISGWGFLANKAVWHNKSKLASYGDVFKQGDTITVTLDLDHTCGTLAFARNGESFGIAVEQLSACGAGSARKKKEFFPAISLYNKEDQVTLVPHPVVLPGSTKTSRRVQHHHRNNRADDCPIQPQQQPQPSQYPPHQQYSHHHPHHPDVPPSPHPSQSTVHLSITTSTFDRPHQPPHVSSDLSNQSYRLAASYSHTSPESSQPVPTKRNMEIRATGTS